MPWTGHRCKITKINNVKLLWKGLAKTCKFDSSMPSDPNLLRDIFLNYSDTAHMLAWLLHVFGVRMRVAVNAEHALILDSGPVGLYSMYFAIHFVHTLICTK